MVCHAAESFLSKPFDTRPRPDGPDDRPPYQGSNPIADVWSAKALEFGGRYLRRAVADGEDVEARGFMMLAATMAGCRFRLRGRPYPSLLRLSRSPGCKHEYQPSRLPRRPPVRAARATVIVTAPAAFRFTYDASPSATTRSRRCSARGTTPRPDALPEILRRLMQDLDAPRGRGRRSGTREDDIPTLVDGALKQQRLLAVAPKEVGADDLRHVITASMTNW